MKTISQQKEIILAQMKQAELQANWWMNSATNGHTTSRKIYRGDGHLLSPEELRDDAMQTAGRHIKRHSDLIEALHQIHSNEQ